MRCWKVKIRLPREREKVIIEYWPSVVYIHFSSSVAIAGVVLHSRVGDEMNARLHGSNAETQPHIHIADQEQKSSDRRDATADGDDRRSVVEYQVEGSQTA